MAQSHSQAQLRSRKSQSLERLAAEEMRRRLRQNQITKHLGFALAVAERGKVVLRMRVNKKHLQVHGVVHGGVLAALADTAGGLATYMTVARGTRVATIEMKINYLEAVEGGSVTAEAIVVRVGRHVAVVDCDITDNAHRLVGKALMTFFVGPFRKNRKKRPA
ncbi:MAG: PaaI family thioesterase [Candidatus Acidiferrales bacterium]